MDRADEGLDNQQGGAVLVSPASSKPGAEGIPSIRRPSFPGIGLDVVRIVAARGLGLYEKMKVTGRGDARTCRLMGKDRSVALTSVRLVGQIVRSILYYLGFLGLTE